MKDFLNKHKLLILLSSIILGILYLTQDYYKKTEEYKLSVKSQYESSLKVNEALKMTIIELKTSISRLESENKKKNKKTKITITKNTDGSSKKDIEIVENEEESKNKKEDIVIDNSKTDISKDMKTEENVKENIVINEELKKTEEKKSNTKGVLIIIGGVVLCFATGICVF